MLVGAQESVDNWLARNAVGLKSVFRVVFGIIWMIDGALKFQPGVADSFSGLVSSQAQGQPGWLHGWFSFWAAQAAANPGLWVYGTGVLELALAFALLTGFMRKIAYTGGIFLSLLIWAVPEGFGGPYGPGSTDIGTGVVYAVVFLFLMVLNALQGPSRYSLDWFLERRWPSWRRLAEIRGSPTLPAE